jgi:hypothetical protein
MKRRVEADYPTLSGMFSSADATCAGSRDNGLSVWIANLWPSSRRRRSIPASIIAR